MVHQDTRNEVFKAPGEGHPLRKASADAGFLAAAAGLLGLDNAGERFIDADQDGVVLGLEGMTLVRIESGYDNRQPTAAITFHELDAIDLHVVYFDWEIDLTVTPSHQKLALITLSGDDLNESVTVSAVQESTEPGLTWLKRLLDAKTRIPGPA